MIRFTYNYLKPIALFLIITFLFQCCKIYHNQPVSVDQAIGDDKKRVKIITSDYKEWIFKSIYYKDDNLYGILLNPSKDLDKIEVLIDERKIIKVYLFDIKKSRKMTILLSVGIPFGTLLIMGIVIAIQPFEFNPLPDGI